MAEILDEKQASLLNATKVVAQYYQGTTTDVKVISIGFKLYDIGIIVVSNLTWEKNKQLPSECANVLWTK